MPASFISTEPLAAVLKEESADHQNRRATISGYIGLYEVATVFLATAGNAIQKPKNHA